MSKRSKKAQVWIGNISGQQKLRVLMFKVVDVRGGGWHPVTGGVDAGEDYFDGAKRELEEETGFDAKAGKWFDLNHTTHFDSRFGSVEEKSYLFIPSGKRREPKLDPSEHVICEWVELDEAELRVRFDGQRNALKLVSDILKFSQTQETE